LPGEFRANFHRGANCVPVKITDQEALVARKAVHTLGLKVAGVDILRSNRGPLVLEVNASPGLEGIETVTGIDIASRIIRYVESEVREKWKYLRNY
jgi:ribosomal protein S6--L-glutamate ligase